MWSSFLVEFIGTFFFLSCILAFGKPIPIALALLAALYFGASISGGHYNPAVSTMFLAKGTLPVGSYVGYVTAQLLGAVAAIVLYRAVSQGPKA
jgi:aquaporin Z